MGGLVFFFNLEDFLILIFSFVCVQHDCFERAVGILRTKSVEEILAIEDCGKETLKAEVQRQSEEDFEAFKTFLCVSALQL